MHESTPVPPILAREFENLTWVDPAQALVNLRWLEQHLPADIDRRVRRLRTNQLKELREARVGAIFAHGLSKTVLKKRVAVAKVEKADFDFVLRWVESNTNRFYPVQLKELPPEDLNPNITLDDVLRGLNKYNGEHNLSVVIHLNRSIRFEYHPMVTRPNAQINELWYLGCQTSDQSAWFLYGNVFHRWPEKRDFDYPRGKPNVA
ncbi:MAG: hypothetical protein RIC85_04935 [Gammaproteobacteria bacterium]